MPQLKDKQVELDVDGVLVTLATGKQLRFETISDAADYLGVAAMDLLDILEGTEQ